MASCIAIRVKSASTVCRYRPTSASRLLWRPCPTTTDTQLWTIASPLPENDVSFIPWLDSLISITVLHPEVTFLLALPVKLQHIFGLSLLVWTEHNVYNDVTQNASLWRSLCGFCVFRTGNGIHHLFTESTTAHCTMLSSPFVSTEMDFYKRWNVLCWDGVL